MSDPHVDKDETPRVNYDEILKAAATATIMAAAVPLAGPILGMYHAIKILQKSKPTPSKPTPTENLMEIIKAGKEQGLSELEIEMDKSAAVGITLGVFTDFGGVSINPEFEGKNRILIRIKYK